MNSTKALGGWNESGAFRNCYDRAFPVDALLGAAAFSARHPEQYSLPRGSLEPPGDLLRQLFPWVEGQQAALSTRSQDARCKDIALRQFLSVLVWFRVVILQDAAVLYSQHPHLSFFTFRPFNSPAFHDFAASSAATIAHAESKARLVYENMPEHLIAGLQGTYADLRMEQRKEQENNACQLEDLHQQYSQLEGRKGKGMCSFFCVTSCANLLYSSTSCHQNSDTSAAAASATFVSHAKHSHNTSIPSSFSVRVSIKCRYPTSTAVFANTDTV